MMRTHENTDRLAASRGTSTAITDFPLRKSAILNVLDALHGGRAWRGPVVRGTPNSRVALVERTHLKEA
ncbi:MAG: hypothetical protein JWM95_4026 [Gemmatimonadetes bacterium]|nr:hypothetical protein [Gemmatimonadota bacterium]